MNKVICLIAIMTWLTACGSGGGTPGEAGGVPAAVAPVCKGLYDVWTSTTDLEQFDLRPFAPGTPVHEYEYTAYDGAKCGYVTNPNHYLEAQLVTTGPNEYQISMDASAPLGGQCATYVYPDSVDGKHGGVIVKTTACNEIQLCLPFGAGTCKTFH